MEKRNNEINLMLVVLGGLAAWASASIYALTLAMA